LRQDTCTNCKSTQTYIIRRKDGTPIQADWRKDKNGNVLCKRCWGRLIGGPSIPKWYAEIRDKKRITYKGKTRHVGKIVRTGICKQCNRSVAKGEIRETHMHHLQYHDDDPLKDTIELCESCHLKETWKLGQFDTPKFKAANERRKHYKITERDTLGRIVKHTLA
jgi:hypothetical protein